LTNAGLPHAGKAKILIRYPLTYRLQLVPPGLNERVESVERMPNWKWSKDDNKLQAAQQRDQTIIQLIVNFSAQRTSITVPSRRSCITKIP
jgi:hypothetical protein